MGSYAVYHKTLKNHRIGGTNYETGKAFHVYRPQVWSLSSSSTKEWAELSYNNGSLCVTVPQTFLDGADYPVRVDPTFGYTTVGGSSNYWTTYVTHTSFTTSGDAGTIDSMSIYLEDVDVDCLCDGVVMGIYNDSSPNGKLAQTDEGTVSQEFAGWKTLDMSSSYSLVDSTTYWLAYQVELGNSGTSGNPYKFYDTGTNRTNLHFVSYSATMPATLNNDSTQSELVSIYATYTDAAEEAGSEIWF